MSIDEDRLHLLTVSPLPPRSLPAMVVWIGVGFLVGLLFPRIRAPFGR